MNTYRIYFSENAKPEKINDLKNVLQGFKPSSLTLDTNNNSLEVTLEMTSKQLHHKLLQASDIYVATRATLGRDGIDNTYWNRALTSLIRNTTQTAWGNWTLDPSVVPGAVGYLNPATGTFTRYAMLPQFKRVDLSAPQAWVAENSSIHQTQSEVKFEGGYKDPSSGVTVNTGLKVDWTFERRGSVTSNATLSGLSLVDNFGEAMSSQFDWLHELAKKYNHVTKDGIAQGFGMVTHVQTCRGATNIGSLSDDSSFSMTGSLDGMAAMTGAGKIDGKVEGSYKEVNKSKAFESRMFPTESNSAAPGEVGLVYQFASYQGRQFFPTWIQKVDNLSVVFDNSHGGTYIGNCKLEYSVPNGASRVSREVTAPGGQVRSIGDIPLDAFDLEISVHFTAGDDFSFVIYQPIARWLTGQCTVDLRGVWPWGSEAKIRDEYSSL